MAIEIGILLLLVGVVSGFLAGLVGIGGGVIIVPALYLFYAHPDMSGFVVEPEIAAVVAHATSLLVIVPTAMYGTRTYSRAGLVVWQAALPIALFSMLGAALGARIAVLLPAVVLTTGFGAFLIFSAARLTRSGRPGAAAPGDAPPDDHAAGSRASLPVLGATGLAVGAFSALLGVGGGLVAIPLLLQVVRMGVKRVAATSLAIVLFAAPAGTLTYMMGDAPPAGMPWGSVGYVHVLAALPIAVGALLSVGLGTRANRALPVKWLRLGFASLFAVLGAYLMATSLL
jgi:uncharacterized protein